MKKLVFGLIATVVFGFVGNAQEFNNNRELEDFINLTLVKNNINLSITNLKQYKLEDYEDLKRYANIDVKEIYDFEPYSLEIVAGDNTYNLHTIPTSDTQAMIIIESANKQINNVLSVDILGYENDVYKISWSDSGSDINNKATSKHDCRTGAGVVTAAGRIIAFGSIFGCLPCGFVGGAISTLGALGYIGCVATGN